MSIETLPLLAARDLSAPLAWRAGVPISGHRFLADVARQAQLLPAQGPAVNLCVDRYAFAVGLAAALVRGQPSLLPPDARPDTLARLSESGEPVYAMADDERLTTGAMPRLMIDSRAAHGESDVVPQIAQMAHAASLLTSGSTGAPQPHAKHWKTLVGDVAAAVPRLCDVLQRPTLEGLNLVATIPVQHSYGLESTALLAMLGGAAFDSGRPFFPADIVRTLESVPRPRALVTTPFHLKTLMRAGIKLPPVDLILSATAPLSPQLAAEAESAMGAVLLEIYGSTETGQVATRRTTQSEVWSTFGEIRVHAQPDADGTERFVFGGDFMPEPTPMADILELLDPQRFRLLGRANDLIHVGGRRSSLGHLNFHLNSVPGVVDGAFWLPEEIADGVVRTLAFVVAPGVAASEIVAALRQRLEPVFVPRHVHHVDSLPREGTGKLTARALREFALAQLARDDTPVHLTRSVPLDHPAFAGHFPGQPLLPGALLLAEVLEAALGVPALAARLGPRPSLAAAKFLSPVRPGAELSISMQPESGAARGVKFEVRVEDTVCVSGRWTPTEAQA